MPMSEAQASFASYTCLFETFHNEVTLIHKAPQTIVEHTSFVVFSHSG